MKVRSNSGVGKVLHFPDAHKLSEGLFLSAWTHWEEFLRHVLIEDLASKHDGALLSEVKRFRTKGAARRLAEKMLAHPDTERWVEWSSFSDVRGRADALLGTGHRFAAPTVKQDDLATLKRLRNAIAHKSDQAWRSFLKLVSGPPFSLAPHQRKGITVGRMLFAHQWKGRWVFEECLNILESDAKALVL